MACGFPLCYYVSTLVLNISSFQWLSSLFLNSFVEAAEMTSSGRLFHGLTTRTEKKF